MNEQLPRGWARATLAEVATWGSGGTPKKSETVFYGGDIPWAVIGDLNDGVVHHCVGAITHAGLDGSSCKLVEPGTVLVAMYGSIGKLGIAGIPMATNQAIAFARSRVDAKYLFYYLLFQRSALGKAGKGATQQNISQTVLKAWPIPVAPPAEQERIVTAIEEHLSRVDAAEAALASAARRLGRLVDSAWTAATDDGWPAEVLSDVLLSSGGKVLRQGWSPKCENSPSPNSDTWAVLKTSSVQLGAFVESANKTLPASLEPRPSLEVVDGDLLMTSGGPRNRIGITCQVVSPRPRLMLCDKMFRFNPDPDRLSPRFLLSYLTSAAGLREIERLKTGSSDSGLRISQGAFASLRVPVPPMDDQLALLRRVNAVRQQVSASEADLRKGSRISPALRRSILLAAFSGALVDQDPADKPASVLLERIASERPAHKTRKTTTV